MNLDCTGSIILNSVPARGHFLSNFVIVDTNIELRLTNTGAGLVLVGNAPRRLPAVEPSAGK